LSVGSVAGIPIAEGLGKGSKGRLGQDDGGKERQVADRECTRRTARRSFHRSTKAIPDSAMIGFCLLQVRESILDTDSKHASKPRYFTWHDLGNRGRDEYLLEVGFCNLEDPWRQELFLASAPLKEEDNNNKASHFAS